MAKVSVISTVYNGEAFFERSSIRGQDYADFDWVVVDDGSTDRTAALLAPGCRPRSPAFGLRHSLFGAVLQGIQLRKS